MGWFYGFKLHLIINDSGEISSCQITPGNVDDRTNLSSMSQGITGQIFGDKGFEVYFTYVEGLISEVDQIHLESCS